MRPLCIILISLLACAPARSQCFDRNFAFKEGELLKYEVYYNLGIIWLNAGWVNFGVQAGEYKGRPIYHFDGIGGTYTSYDWIFKVRDHYQCYLDKETLKPLWFHRQNYEGGFEVDYRYLFDHSQNRVISYTENSDRPFRKDTVSIDPCTFDVQSIIYYARNLDFSGLRPGDSISVKAFIDNEMHDLYIRYHGKEMIKTRAGETYRCIKFTALLVHGTIFEGGENMVVWVTDDKNRVPVLVNAKILVGSIKTYLKSAEGLRNPQDALIQENEIENNKK